MHLGLRIRKSALAAIVMILLWLGIDFWVISGRVLDARTKEPLPNATVLISLHAREPDPPYPHAWVANSRCLRTVVVATDERGRFRTLQFSTTPWLIREGITIDAFKNDWYLKSVDQVAGKRRPLGLFFKHDVQLHSNTGQRWSFSSGELSPRDHSDTMSAYLTAAARFGSGENVCTKNAWLIVREAMLYAISHADTDAEIRYVRLRCQDAHNVIAVKDSDWRWPKPIGDDVLRRFPECVPLFKADNAT